ncbi:rab effector MyRIP-like isoform X1 [Acipenser ruthenus]|uniref:rab effector MyRIP-like isoform X1 n=1 Tax=Acipenser ruthenus TaxID=7906 RepID=UPI0027404491|nr:rab effector MyRIP-like isoform X1 [Acipenser ruthenus]XP_058870715.1 rab effector MyRIP-like isoform X1 [Acipenser ruthenus]
MGRKLDLSSLTEDEADHVLQVVQRDMCLRKKEEERLNEMKQQLDEEGSKCTILARQNKFNDHCCMRCCSPFTFLINTKRQCLDCKFNVCKSCSSYIKKEKAWICAVCQKSRLLRTQSLEWYYNNIKSRFKRFGSSKVLKMLYRKHCAERGAFSDIGGIHEESVDNAESTCGSDSTFYRQSEGHSMAETLTVALRVAEEAIEEAISKAEEYRGSLEKQNEAHYLRDNKEKLIEELATTIVQKIIRRRKNSEMQPDSEMAWPLSRSSGQTSPTISEHSTVTSQTSHKGSHILWRSQSAFSLTGDKPPEQPMDSNWKSTISEAIWSRQEGYPSLKNDPKTFTLPSWRSMDRLDNSTPSSVLQSPDGNWIALQSTFQPRPSLVTKPKSQVFTALERESATISAYDDLGSDTEDEYDLNELRRRPRRLSGETYYTDSQYDPEWTNTRHRPVNSPSSGQYTDTETMFSDSETSSVHSVRDSLLQICKQQVLKRKGPDHGEALDINFNPQAYGLGTVDSSEAEEPNKDSVRRSRRRRKSKPLSREHAHDRQSYQAQSTAAYQQIYDDSLGAGAVNGGFHPQREADALEMKLKSKLSELTANVSDNESSSGEEREKEDIRLTQVPLESSCYEERQIIQEDTRKKYSAVSLCNITMEVLKVINATEELIEEATGDSDCMSKLQDKGRLCEGTDTGKLQEHLAKLEENVYLTASTVYGLEGQLGDLEDCARSINSITTENQLAHLEDQVASAAAQVHRAEIQISDIEISISALKNAGLNVTPCMQLAAQKEQTPRQPQTIDTSRQQRRKLPAPPKGDKISPALTVTGRTFSRNSFRTKSFK